MLLEQYVNGQFSMQSIYTVGTNFLAKELNFDGNIIKLQFWDTSGAKEFLALKAGQYRNSECCVLVFDLTDQKSFKSIEFWRNEFLNGLKPKDPGTFPFVLIGNKCDKVAERKVQQKAIDEYCATKPNMTYFEVSAKDNKNLDTAFYEVARLAYKRNFQEDEKFIPNRDELKAISQPTSKSNFKEDKVEEIFIPNKVELICTNPQSLEEKETQKLKSTIKQLENDKSNLTKEIQILKKKDKEYENIIMNLKNQINELNNQHQLLKNKIIENTDNKNDILDLMHKLEKKNDEIKELKEINNAFNLKKGEKLMTVIFISVDEGINYALICKNTDKFSRIEELLYEKYPDYKQKENSFLYNGKRINRFDTIEENGIQFSSIITLNNYEYE